MFRVCVVRIRCGRAFGTGPSRAPDAAQGFDFSSRLVHDLLQSSRAGISPRLRCSAWKEDSIEGHVECDSGSRHMAPVQVPWFFQVWFWASHFTSLNLSFYNFKMGMIPTWWDSWDVSGDIYLLVQQVFIQHL